METRRDTAKNLWSWIALAAATLILLATVVPFEEVIAQWSGKKAASFASGSGTAADPYIIADEAEFALFLENIEGGVTYEGVCFKLASDLDMTGHTWVTQSGLFSGSLDGQFYKVKADCRLFYNLGEKATVKNLDYTVVSPIQTQILCAVNAGTILNVHAEGTVTVSSAAICTTNTGTIANSRFSGSISQTVTGYYSDSNVTLIYSNTGTISNCFSTMTMGASSYNNAYCSPYGIVGITGGTVTNCYYLSSALSVSYGEKGGIVTKGSVGKTEEELKSADFCTLLNTAVSGNTSAGWAAWYRTSGNYPALMSIVDNGTCSSNGLVKWCLNTNGSLVISGTGAMTNYTATTLGSTPWSTYADRITSVFVDEGVTSVGDYAFYGFTKNYSAKIADSVTAIGKYAFGSTLIRLTMPVSVTEYYTSSFSSCTALKNIVLTAGNNSGQSGSSWSSYYSYAPWGGTRGADLDSLTLSEGITTIAENMFYQCKFSGTLILPAGLTAVATKAFYGSSITEFVFSGQIPSFGSLSLGDLTASQVNIRYPSLEKYGWSASALPGASALGSSNATFTPYRPVLITGYIGSNVSYTLYEDGEMVISGTGAMSDRSQASQYPWAAYSDQILTLTVENGVTSVGNYAFSGCSSLGSFTLGESVTVIGAKAFLNCTSLTSLTIPDTVQTIKDGAFEGCNSLTGISIPFAGMSRDATGSQALFGYIFGNGTSADVKQNYSTSSGIFYKIPAGIKKITVTDAGALKFGAFWNVPCEELVLVGGVKSIGNYCFYGCNAGKLIFTGNAPAFSDSAFQGSTLTAEFDVFDTTWNAGTFKNYGGTVTWASAYHGTATASGTCGEHAKWAFDYAEKRLTIYGYGPIEDYTVSSVPGWDLNYAFYTYHIYIGEGITRVGNSTFDNRSGYVTSVYLPTTLESIGTYAFCNMSNLGLTGLSELTFRNAGKLTIDSLAFSVAQISSIDFGDGEITLGANSFRYNDAITSLTIPSNVKVSAADGANAFRAFSYCDNLKNVRIENDCVGPGMFYSCPALASVTVTDPETVFLTVSGGISYPTFDQCPAFTLTAPQCSTARAIGQRYGATFVQIDDDTTTHSVVDDPAVDPDCTHTGLTAGKHCEKCGIVTVARETVDAKGHRYEITTVRPTADSDGKAIFDCLDCEHTEERAYSESPCVHEMDTDDYQSAHPYENDSDLTWTVTVEGAEVIGLTFSGDTAFEEEFDFLYVNETEYTGTELAGKTLWLETGEVTLRLLSDEENNDYGFALSGILYEKHDYESEVIEPSCLEQGYTEHTCRDCTASYVSDLTDPLNHDWDDGEVQKAASGTTPGEMLHHCRRDGCDATKVEPIPAPLLGEGEWGELTWTLSSEGLLTISGSGEMADFGETSEEAWRPYADKIAEVSCASTVTSIGDYAFAGSALSGSLKISNKTRIGAGAYENCTGITAITISKTIETIGEDAFAGCTGVTKLTVNATSYTVGAGAFEPSFCNHVHTSALTGTPADCEHSGLSDGVQCDICGTVTVTQEELEPLGHQLTHVPAQEATEDAEGNIEYYYCEECEKYFSDAQGLNEICQLDTVIPKKGTEGNPHTYADVMALLEFVTAQAEESTTASAAAVQETLDEVGELSEEAEVSAVEEAFGKLTAARGLLIPYTVVVVLESDPEGVALSGAGKYAAGDTVTLGGEFDGYSLLGWYIGEEMLEGSTLLISETDSGTITVCAKLSASEESRYSVVLYSRVVGGDSSIARMTGGGEYYSVRGGDIWADAEMEGFEFIGWFEGLTSDPEAKLFSAENEVHVNPEETVVLTALYRPRASVSYAVAVSADEYTITGQEERQYDEKSFTYAPGTKVTLTYEDDTRELLYWTDGNGRILSRERSFTFVVTGDTSVTAFSLPAGADGVYADVYFADIDGNVISSRLYLITETIVFPAAPEVTGKEFVGWSMTQTAIRKEMAASKKIVVRAIYRD